MKKVQAGDNLEIKASTWNAFIDAANFVKGIQSNQHGSIIRNGMFNGVVFIKNTERATYPQFSALVLTDILIKPDKNEAEFKGKISIFAGVKMTETLAGKPYAILLEPLESGKIGRGLLLGVIPAKVKILDNDDEFAIPTANSSVGLLESSATGVARILWKAGNSGEQWCMLQLGGASSGTGVYNGLFKLVDNSEVDDDTGETTSFSMKVVDGNNPKSEATMPCYVNGQAFNIPIFESEVSNSSRQQYVYLKFTIPQDEDNETPAVEAMCEIVIEEEAMSQDEEFAFYQLGRIEFVNNKMKLYQDHILGNVHMFIFGSGCYYGK